MDEYIEKNKAIKELYEVYDYEFPTASGGFDEYARMIVPNTIKNMPAADVAPVRHGRWMYTKKHLWYKNKDGSIDEWRLDVGFHNGPMCQVCGEAVCMHCYPDWESMECETGHYLCSVCSEVSTDAHENYCPNCGAKMDGGSDHA